MKMNIKAVLFDLDGTLLPTDQDVFVKAYFSGIAAKLAPFGYNPKASDTVKKIKKDGIRVALATNPIFPSIATEKRIRWAGLTPDDFEFFTTYENSKYCKPNLCYYKELLKQLGIAPEECLMVGNDVGDDMVAEELRMNVFLLTDCLINKTEKDISNYHNGGFGELLQFIDLLRSK